MPQEAPRQRHGCLFYGGIIAVVLLVSVLIAALLGLRLAKRMLNEFTDTKPLALPAVQMPAAELERVRQRVTAFQQAVSNHRPSETLALTSDEINALIATDQDLSFLKGKVYVMIEGDRVKAQVSVPLDEVGLPFFKGRYLNGVATLDVGLDHGVLRVVPEAISVKGKPLPAVYGNKLRKQNLAENINDDSRASNGLQQLENIQVKDSKLIIVPKKP